MYEIQVNDKPFSEHGSRDDAIASIAERLKLDILHEMELNGNGMTYKGMACITLSHWVPSPF